MATTSITALGDTGAVDGALAMYLRSIAEPNLFNNYEFVALATQAMIPSGQGIFMNIPSFANNSTSGVKGATWADRANSLAPVASGSEHVPLLGTSLTLSNFRSTSVSNTDRKMSYFSDGFVVSKLYKNTATVQGEFERVAMFIMKTAAATQEILLQNNIIYESGNALTDPTDTGTIWNGLAAAGEGYTGAEPIYVSPDVAGTAWGSILATDLVVANKFAKARKYLKEQGNPGFSRLGGRLAALVGPDTVYALSTQVAATSGHADLTFENDSMNQTRVFTDAVVGDLFGFRLIETNNPIIVVAGTTNQPGNTGVDCEVNVLFAPDAFYVTPHANLTPQIYISGFGEGGALNPTKSMASVATDFAFGALRGPEFTKKIVLLPTPTT